MALSREEAENQGQAGVSELLLYLPASFLWDGSLLAFHITPVYGYVMAPNNWHLRKVLQYSLNAWVGTCQITIRHLVRALHNLQSWGLDFLLSCMFYFASCSVWFQSSAPFILPASCSPHSKSFSLPASRPILPCGCTFLLNYEPTPRASVKPSFSHSRGAYLPLVTALQDEFPRGTGVYRLICP